jgi:hypothetical protein
MNPANGKRILDIGCGCADKLTLLPSDVGYDLSPQNISYARISFGHLATFQNQRVNNIELQSSQLFYIVLADGLPYHPNDIESVELFKVGGKSCMIELHVYR